MMRLLIIGNGIAALSAAESFRKYDLDSEVVILTSDAYLTYYRTRLSHMLGRPDFPDEDLLVRKPSWYQEKKINVRMDTRVTFIDFQNRVVTTAGGEVFPYDQLLLANGAHPFIPPVGGTEKKGVFTLYGLDDLKAVRKYLENKKQVVVLGGGLLGIEVAHGLIGLGKAVTVLEFFPQLLPRQLDVELSGMVQEQLTQEGMKFLLGRTCSEILGTEEVTGIRLDNGAEIQADGVLLSTGVRPNVSLFKGSTLGIGRGILVDDRMRTNLPGVYAAGDIAEFKGTVFGLWTASMEHGKIAGANLAGQESTYEAPLIVTTLNIGKVKLFSAGTVAEPDSVLTYRDEKSFHRLFIKDGRVSGAVLTGDLSLMPKARSLVIQKKEVLISVEGADPFLAMMQ